MWVDDRERISRISRSFALLIVSSLLSFVEGTLFMNTPPLPFSSEVPKQSFNLRDDLMSGHSELEVVNQPFEYYGPQQHDKLSPVVDGSRQIDENGRPDYQEETKFIGMPVFPAELPFDNYNQSPIALSHRTSSNLSAQQYSACSEAPSSPALHNAPLINQPVSTEKEAIVYTEETQRKRKVWKWYILAGIIGLIVIIAAVVGGVVASKKKNEATVDEISSSTESSNSSSPTTSSTNSATSNSPTSTIIASLASSTVAPFQRNVAAISYESNNVNNSRVYYQDNQGNILEAHNNASSGNWSISPVVTARNGSSFAAAVTMPQNDFEITLLYSDSDNLLHDIIYNVASDSWREGTLSSEKYIVSENSSVAVMYWQCRLCSNTTIIAFQDANNKMQVGNLTASGWDLTQIMVDVVDNTGLALQPFYRQDEADQINLYYQNPSSVMTISAWEYPTGAWKLDAASYYSFTFNMPIASSASYSHVDFTGDVETGFESWGETLVLSRTGIKTNTYSGAINGWSAMGSHPSAMANSTQNPKVFKSIAVTAIGAAFAVVEIDGKADEIEAYQVKDDAINWETAGTVDIGDIWG